MVCSEKKRLGLSFIQTTQNSQNQSNGNPGMLESISNMSTMKIGIKPLEVFGLFIWKLFSLIRFNMDFLMTYRGNFYRTFWAHNSIFLAERT